jgi:hypothetical protein
MAIGGYFKLNYHRLLLTISGTILFMAILLMIVGGYWWLLYYNLLLKIIGYW